MSTHHLMLAGLRIEYRDILHTQRDKKTIVLLHEGLGSISMWRDFPQKLAHKTGCRVIVWSRAGYGHSDAYDTPRTTRYLHHEGETMLPLLLEALSIEKPVVLGHSDGGSIGLIYAFSHPRQISGLVVIAPHEFNEPAVTAGIHRAVHQFEHSHWAHKLGKHHADVNRVFRDWSGIWLSKEHADWSIVDDLSKITCPILAMQGVDDEYATLRQIEVIAEKTPQTTLLKIPHCGHNPQFEKEAVVIKAVADFIGTLGSWIQI